MVYGDIKWSINFLIVQCTLRQSRLSFHTLYLKNDCSNPLLRTTNILIVSTRSWLFISLYLFCNNDVFLFYCLFIENTNTTCPWLGFPRISLGGKLLWPQLSTRCQFHRSTADEKFLRRRQFLLAGVMFPVMGLWNSNGGIAIGAMMLKHWLWWRLDWLFIVDISKVHHYNRNTIN